MVSELRPIMKTKTSFVSIILASTLAYGLPAHSLEGFESICTLDSSCAVEKSTLVAFKSGDTVTYRTLSGNFICNPATFALDETASAKASSADNGQCYSMTGMTGFSNSDEGSSSETQQPQQAKLPSGSFAIVAVSSGKALALSGPDAADQRVVQQNFRQLPSQIWQVTALDNGYHSIGQPNAQMALESKDWDTRDGAKLQQTEWINSWNQQWQLEPVGTGVYTIRSRFSSHALDVYEINDKHNADVVLWTYWGGENQHWRLVPIDQPDATEPTEK